MIPGSVANSRGTHPLHDISGENLSLSLLAPGHRRSAIVAIAVSAALVLAGCSSDDSSDGGSDSSASNGETRTVTDTVDNEVEVTANPQTIVPLHFAGV